MARHVDVDRALWQEFHRVVNMSSRELLGWLRTDSADEHTEQTPERSGPEIGRQVLQILRKRRTDLDARDAATMRDVVDTVKHADNPDGLTSPADWRHRLMTIGHDPLRELR